MRGCFLVRSPVPIYRQAVRRLAGVDVLRHGGRGVLERGTDAEVGQRAVALGHDAVAVHVEIRAGRRCRTDITGDEFE